MAIHKSISELLQFIDPINVYGPLNGEIYKLHQDSRDCRPQSLFFAIRGYQSDGHAFISQAADNGASAVIHASSVDNYIDGVTYIQVKNVRWAMSAVSAGFYGTQQQTMKIIGVTGTDGKSSTCDYIYQMLINAGKKTALLSSVWKDNGSAVGRKRNTVHMTTPDSIDIHEFLYESTVNNCEFAVVEASSHGLSHSLARLAHVAFHAGVCTNITSEHLDFHKTRTSYREAKMNLFQQLVDSESPAVVPADTDWLQLVKKGSVKTWHFGDAAKTAKASRTTNAADISSHNLVLSIHSASHENTVVHGNLNGKTFTVSVNLTLKPQLLNFAAALLTVHQVTGKLPFEITNNKATIILKGIPGRFQYIKNKALPFTLSRLLVLDFAHTPNAFQELFSSMKAVNSQGKFIAMFGSAGNRDREKRALLGAAAAQYCDIIILTEEDPRQENPDRIFSDIQQGIPEEFTGEVFVEPNRSDAIRFALNTSNDGDTLFFLGKGHETTIEYANYVRPWDEEQAIISCIYGFREDGS